MSKHASSARTLNLQWCGGMTVFCVSCQPNLCLFSAGCWSAAAMLLALGVFWGPLQVCFAITHSSALIYRTISTKLNARMALVYYMDFSHCHGCAHLFLCSTAGGPFPLVLVVLAASTAGRAELYGCDVICMSTAARMGLSICWMLQCLPGIREAVLLVVLCVMSGVL